MPWRDFSYKCGQGSEGVPTEQAIVPQTAVALTSTFLKES